LNCSIGNSKSQLHKARMRLRQLLGEGRHRTRLKTTAESETKSVSSCHIC
jgi:hypothetical protein